MSTANAVLAAGPVVDQRLTTPLLAICRTAALSFEDAIMPDVPLSAIRLLTLLLKVVIRIKELINAHMRLLYDVCAKQRCSKQRCPQLRLIVAHNKILNLD